MSEFSILPGLKDPAALKNLTSEELETLSDEIREYIINIVNKNGGHMASNLGAVELTIALHRSFNSPFDKIVWDVGHQCYTHKLLTGRYKEFVTLRQFGGMSGFPKREESVHDIMNTGHASTSVSAALGVLVGEHLNKSKARVIAVIGDGSLTGGQALEAMNHAGHISKNLIIILNDNNMSIGRNVGALSSYMSRLTSTGSYQQFRDLIDKSIRIIPFFGKAILRFVYRLKRGAKGVFYKENLFTKGKGLTVAEDDPSGFHGVSPILDKTENEPLKQKRMMLTEAYGRTLVEAAEENEQIVAVTAAMTNGTGLKGTGLVDFSEKYPDRFFDVGITEPHALTYSAGLAITGKKPFVSIYSTFMQRAVDQVFHDIAIPSLPVTIVMDRSGLVPGDGETHQGLYDIALFKTVPGVIFISPVNLTEMEFAIKMAQKTNGPFMIRYAKDVCFEERNELTLPFVTGRGVFLRKSEEEKKILILSLGSLLSEAEKCADLLEERDISTDIYNMRFIAPIDIDYLFDIVSNYTLTVFIEDGVKTGGLGESIAARMFENNKNFHFRYFGAPDKFLGQATREELIKECGLDGESLMNEIINI
jgi:1-deoxy-D-xylulose-5-phosphate synthase